MCDAREIVISLDTNVTLARIIVFCATGTRGVSRTADTTADYHFAGRESEIICDDET